MESNYQKKCCVTGHRDIPAERMDYVRESLGKEINLAIADGCNYFISGFAKGVDLMFAEEVSKRIRNDREIFLEAAIPYAGRLDTGDPLFQSLLPYCCRIHVTNQVYDKQCFLDRNLYMIQNSQRLIAVYDGRRRGGTLYTMNRAYGMGKEVRVIRV